MQIVNKSISIKSLKNMASPMFGNLIKAVVDIDQEIMVLDAELHSDQEKELLNHGSKQEALWGINLYPELFNSNDFIEFDSMINIRPSQNNPSRDINNPQIKNKIKKIVNKLIRT